MEQCRSAFGMSDELGFEALINFIKNLLTNPRNYGSIITVRDKVIKCIKVTI